MDSLGWVVLLVLSVQYVTPDLKHIATNAPAAASSHAACGCVVRSRTLYDTR